MDKAPIKRLVGALLTLLFVACYANASLFVHTHIVDDQTIVHSHFYDSHHTENQDNSGHGDKEIDLISHLNHVLYTDQISYDLGTDFSPCDYRQTSYNTLDVACSDRLDYRPNSLRGPPSLL